MSLRKFYPKGPTDAMCMFFCLVAFPTVIIHGCAFLLPALLPTDSMSYKIHFVALLFIWLNVVINYFKSVTVDTSTRQLSLPVVLQEGWHYCYWCQSYSPARSYHCPLCNVCVIRRDHHCYFTGHCVGLQNHRYFLMFLIYALIGSIYGMVLSIVYTIQVGDGLSLWTLLSFFLPVLVASIGQLPVTPLVAFLTSCSIATTLATFTYLALQFACFRKGQTYFEWQRKVLIYDKGLLGNCLEIFGSNIWLVWIAPFVPSPLPTDGSDYPIPTSAPTQAKVEEMSPALEPEGTRPQGGRKRAHHNP